MPIYEYKCPECGKVVEQIDYRIPSRPTVCPVDAAFMVRIASAPAFVIKGFSEKNGYTS